MKTITLQPAPIIDQITEDGKELTKLPYPLHCDPEGNVLQDIYRGWRVMGFTRDLHAERIDISWEEARDDLDKVIGTYVVTCDEIGEFATHLTAVASTKVQVSQT